MRLPELVQNCNFHKLKCYKHQTTLSKSEAQPKLLLRQHRDPYTFLLLFVRVLILVHEHYVIK